MKRSAAALAWVAGAAMAAPPDITSAELIMHLSAEPQYITVGVGQSVQTWTAANDPSIVFTRMGTATPSLITFAEQGLVTFGAVVFDDDGGSDATLQETLPAAVSGDVTIFWLGYYTVDSDTSGRYVYSIGTSGGSGGTQLSHQSQRTAAGGVFVELFNGDTTFRGDSIATFQDVPVVWRTQYTNQPVNGSTHWAWANCTPLNVQTTTEPYIAMQTPKTMFLGGWQSNGFNMEGRVGAILVYDGVVSEEDAAAITAYLHTLHCPNDLSGSSDPNSPCYGLPDGAVDSSDFFYFLDQFVAGNVAVADLSGSSDPNDPAYGVPDGQLDASDFFFFLDQFVSGCV